jgi:hypothetical protein
MLPRQVDDARSSAGNTCIMTAGRSRLSRRLPRLGNIMGDVTHFDGASQPSSGVNRCCPRVWPTSEQQNAMTNRWGALT